MSEGNTPSNPSYVFCCGNDHKCGGCGCQCHNLTAQLAEYDVRWRLRNGFIDRLSDERDRLREALERIQTDDWYDIDDLKEIVRKVLAGAAEVDTADNRLTDETTARQKYAVTGRFIPLSENGVMQVGLDGAVNIPETTHEVYICDSQLNVEGSL